MDSHSRYQYLVQFAYVGTEFYGVQPQRQFPTAGGALFDFLTDYSGGEEPHALCFTARTDRGVHAHDNFATCWFRDPPLARPVRPSKGLIVRTITLVPKNTHARTISNGKQYRYVIEDNTPLQAAITQSNAYAWQIHPILNERMMDKAAAYLLGTHDFTSFRGARCEAGTPVKTISKFEVTRCRNQIHITIEADAFVRKMIRNLVGLLAEVGAGLRDPDCVPNILSKMHRHAAGIMAPPQGLTLEKIILANSISKLI